MIDADKLEHPLTPRELEVLAFLADGFNYAETARILGISRNTVHTHLRRIFAKARAHTTTEAVAWALRSGVLT